MKILWVKHGKLLPVDTGGKIRSFNILRHLASNHSVTLISAYGGKRDPGYEKELTRHFANALPIWTGAPEDTDGTRARGMHYFARLFSAVPYAVSKFTAPEVRRVVQQKLDSREFDVAVCDFLAVSLNFPKTLNTPTVLFQHNVETFLWSRQARCERNWMKKLIFKLEAAKMKQYETTAIKRFHHVIAVSDSDRQLMSAAAPMNITVVPTGVDLQQFRAAAPSNSRIHEVLFTGSMDWEANIDAVQYFCEDIWPRVLSEVPDAKFLIVGRNPHTSVKKLACASVEVTGTVPSVIEYLQTAEVVIVPLRIGGGTRLKIYEAMAMEKPIVSTSIGAEGLEIHDGKDIVLCDKPLEFASWIVRLLRDKELRERIGKAASDAARKYDWSLIVPRFGNVLAQVAGLQRPVENSSRVEMDVSKQSL